LESFLDVGKSSIFGRSETGLIAVSNFSRLRRRGGCLASVLLNEAFHVGWSVLQVDDDTVE
jgi:hypothetical protein